MKYIIYRIVKFVIYPIFILLYKPKFIGRDNIPKKGRVILAGNHTHNFDAAIMIAGSKRVVHMMAKKELFIKPLQRIFFKSMACISVDRSIHDENAKSEAIEVLNNDEVLGIFPEGTINNTKDIVMPFKFGAVSFAKKTDSVIVPFSITGKYKRNGNITITYGKPYKISGNLEKDNNELMNKVKNLIIGEKNEKK